MYFANRPNIQAQGPSDRFYRFPELPSAVDLVPQISLHHVLPSRSFDRKERYSLSHHKHTPFGRGSFFSADRDHYCTLIDKRRERHPPGPAWRRQDPPGRSLGVKAITEGYRTYFTQAISLIASLTKAYSENRIEERLKFYCQPKLLIIGEIGYIPIDRHGAHLFFHLISRRYEKGTLILTSNRSFSQWNEIFGDQVIATAILDRIPHHSTTVYIKGNSCRLMEKVKAGRIREPEVEEN